ncbi:ankyrin [Xylaria scruposa]|nr:ankyrin [Xylaria scruposa]
MFMDPLSLTASVIAVIGALRAVTKGYKCIADIGRASQEFIELVDEIESVHAYLGMLHSVLGSSTQAFATVDLTPLGAAISRLDYTIQRLQSALKQVEADSKTSDDRKISKIKWQIYKSRIIQLRDEVHSRKQDLVDKVGILQLALSLLHTNLLPISCAKTQISYNDNSSSGRLQSTAILKNKQSNFLSAGPCSQARRGCNASCSCRCHRPSGTNSQPWLLITIRQILSLVTTTSYWEPALCDDQVCRDATEQKLALVYQIPLLQHAIWFRLTWTSVFGPGASLHLRVARVVPHSRARTVAACGTPQMLQYLFETRKALPNDMAPSGESLLLTAISYYNNEVIDYLLELGADTSQPDFFGCSPALLVRYRARHEPSLYRSINKLQILAEDYCSSELLEYPLLEALANGTDADFERALNEYPSLVNEPTEFGLTLLHRATKLGRCSAMKLLLLRGADPNKRDVFWRAPLHLAIMANNSEAVQILLPFASDISLLDRRGRNPLELALWWSSSEIISLLLSSSMNKGKLIRDDPWNAFEWLANRKSSYCEDEDELEAIAHSLLNAGLKFDDYGGVPCEQAARDNNCHALRVLLKLGAKFYIPEEGEASILHTAGYYANLETIELLREVDIKELDPDAKFGGWTALEIFEHRETHTGGELHPRQKKPNEEESMAFRTLINEVRERYNNTRILLEADGPKVDNSEENGAFLNKEDRKAVGKQQPLPGAWVE